VLKRLYGFLDWRKKRIAWQLNYNTQRKKLPWLNSVYYLDSPARPTMPANGLTPGTTNRFQVRAIGGSTGYTNWSDPVSHISM
jgi:hypothetical protein